MTDPATPFLPSLGRFEARRFLGRGAMGDVYLAYDPELGEEVALKYIRKSSGDNRADQDVLDAERRGAELQKRVSTLAPQVATVHEYGDLDDLFYVSMEFVDGVDLLEVLERAEASGEAIDTARTIDIGFQLCEILEVLHDFEIELEGKRITSIIHGDIKPENLRLQHGDRLRMLDFGVAKHLSLTRKATRNLFGSYPYTPPERLRTGLVDEGADLWAVGILLYRMASGTQPYPGRTPEELERQICSTPPLPLPHRVPEGLRSVIERTLALEPKNRYPTAASLRDDLEALRDGRPPAPYLVDFPADSSMADATVPIDHQILIDNDETRRTAPALALEDTRRTGTTESSQRAASSDGSDGSARLEPDLEATRRTLPHPPDVLPDASLRRASIPPAEPGSPASEIPGAANPTDAAPALVPRSKLRAAVSRWRRSSPRLRRWLLWIAIAAVVSQLVAQNAAREALHEIHAEASPDLDRALDHYRTARALRPLDIGLGGVRKPLRVALVAEADRVIARFRGDTPTAVRKDWVQARRYLESALAMTLGGPKNSDGESSAKLLYCQAQLDRIDARSLLSDSQNEAAQRKWDDAIFGFERAAELAPSWPDPFLGLSRIYAYEQLDLDQLTRALESALSRGHSWGDRERAQLADAHSTLGMKKLSEAAVLRDQRGERDQLLEARRHLELAAAGYERILSFGNAKKNRDAVVERLSELSQRLRQLRRI